MILLKIILDVIIGVLALLTVLLDHQWRDRRTRGHKCAFRTLIVCLCLALAGNLANTVMDQRATDRDRSKLTNQIASLRNDLGPFIAQAAEQFPNESARDALIRLAEQIEAVTQWRGSFARLDPELARAFVGRLIEIRAKYGASAPSIRVQRESGSFVRDQFAQELGVLLAEAKAGGYTADTIIGFAPSGHIACIYPSSQDGFVRELLDSLGDWMTGEIHLQPQQHSENEVVLHINGTPEFRNDGRVRLQ